MEPMKLEQFRLPKRHLAILKRAVESGEYSSKSDAARAGIEKVGLELDEKYPQGATA
jgi:Arc/MetJ-type ribon-helix-helix transcriptional regulator